MPFWIINFVHSLQGNKVTYNFAPSKSFLLPLKLEIAFNSAWQTNGYFVFKKLERRFAEEL